jgi:hypothetical protein
MGTGRRARLTHLPAPGSRAREERGRRKPAGAFFGVRAADRAREIGGTQKRRCTSAQTRATVPSPISPTSARLCATSSRKAGRTAGSGTAHRRTGGTSRAQEPRHWHPLAARASWLGRNHRRAALPLGRGSEGHRPGRAARPGRRIYPPLCAAV